MFASTHIDMTQTVLSALCWPGDIKLAARSAAWPDAVRAVEVEGLGAHWMGMAFNRLVHFLRPIGDGRFDGYCWAKDRSVPDLDLTHRRVVPRPEAWGFPVIDSHVKREPLAVLVHDLTQPGHEATIEADRITYSTAAAEATWCYNLYIVWACDSRSAKRQDALDTLAGWMMHLAVQDPAVDHHRLGILLGGHTAFEADMNDEWMKMRHDGTADALIKSFVAADNVSSGMSVRTLSEDVGSAWTPAPRRLGLYRCFWRRGWNKRVRTCVDLGLLGSVRLGKILLESCRAAGG